MWTQCATPPRVVLQRVARRTPCSAVDMCCPPVALQASLPILDTRDPVNVGLAGPFISAVGQDLQVTGPIATTTGPATVVPAGATGVILNVTVVGPTTSDAVVRTVSLMPPANGKVIVNSSGYVWTTDAAGATIRCSITQGTSLDVAAFQYAQIPSPSVAGESDVIAGSAPMHGLTAPGRWRQRRG